jgi:uncharacterized membrane protein
MGLVWVFLVALVAFLVIDAVWLKFVTYPFFAREVGAILRDDLQIGVAAGFYVLYVAGVLYFAVMPALESGGLGRAVVNGALLGLLAYGTYEATNMATIKGWTWSMVVLDTGWGMVLTGLTAAIGYGTARLVA